MYKQMYYKGFITTPHFSIEDKVIYGHLDNVDGYISYESDSLSGVEQAFKEAVDDYIASCEKRKEPISSNLLVLA